MASPVILVAEDDTQVRHFAEFVLREADCAVIPASNGEEALHIARSSIRIDLLLTDVKMDRGPDGLQLAEHLIRERGIRVLVMSGSPEAQNRALEKGYPFLAKPFTADGLNRRVLEVLSARPVASERIVPVADSQPAA